MVMDLKRGRCYEGTQQTGVGRKKKVTVKQVKVVRYVKSCESTEE